VSAAELIEGEVSASGRRVAIVAARFNDFIVASLLKGARASWLQRGGSPENLTVVRVPGAFELPVVARKLAGSGRYDAVVALGCVIRGDTIHFEIVSQLSAQGLMELSVARAIPIGNGIVTVNTVTQAMARARIEEQDKGGDAASAALALVRLKRRLERAK
jgi:6,7-dimethyl-8-ribityllumazine synthase